MEIGIIGGGSVGLLIGSYLSNKHNITMYVRREAQKEKINKEGLFIKERNRKHSIKALLLKEIKKEELIIVCVKQPQLADVLDSLPIECDSTPLLFLQNGMTHIDQISVLHNPIFLGVVEHGALREEENRLTHTGKGIISIASYNTTKNALNILIEQLNTEEFPIHKSSDYKQLLKEKLIVNAVINPLTAIVKLKNSSIITNASVRFLAKKVCWEVAQTLQLDPKEQWMRIDEIARKTRENNSSMLTDVLNKKETEVETILGYILAISREELPYTSFAYYSIKAVEINKEENK